MINLSTLKKYLNSFSIEISGPIFDDTLIEKLSSIYFSKKNHMTFYNNPKLVDSLKKTKASFCLIQKDNIELLPKNCLPLIVDDPYLAYAYTTNLFYPKKKSNNKISILSNLNINSQISKNVQINNFTTIHANTSIDDNVIILENCSIGPNVIIGKNTIIKSGCVISNTIIGDNCLVQSGSILGDQGFGFTTDDKVEIIHLGNIIIGNNVQIGSNTTIDRATLDSTIIGDNVRIDNLVQIAHNVIINKNTIIAAQTGIAGSAKVGSNCKIGGQVGISGHINIGDNVIIAAKSGVTKNIKNNSVIAGFPATDINVWKRSIIKLQKKI